MGIFLLGLALGAILGSVITVLILRRRAPMPVIDGHEEFSRLLGDSDAPVAPEVSNLAALEQDLRVKCLHNNDLMERLIQSERERTPDASREQLLQAAIRRWERSNG
jgi:hypothetical protein